MFYKAMLKKKKNKRAFTLIELIVVIAIIGVLVAILVPTMTGFVNDAKKQTAIANARTVYSIAQAEATYEKTTGTTTPTADTIKTAIGSQLGNMQGTYDITVDGTGTVTAATFTLTDKTTVGTYPIPSAPPAQ